MKYIKALTGRVWASGGYVDNFCLFGQYFIFIGRLHKRGRSCPAAQSAEQIKNAETLVNTGIEPFFTVN